MSYIVMKASDAKKYANEGGTRKYRPYKVVHHIEKGKIIGYDPKFSVIFIYATDGSTACQKAAKLWKKWERAEKGIKPEEEYPKLSDLGRGAAWSLINDDDYKEYHNYAERHPLDRYRYVGDPQDPVAFTLIDDDFTHMEGEDSFNAGV